MTKRELDILTDALCAQAERDLRGRLRKEQGLSARRASDVVCGFREGVEALAKALVDKGLVATGKPQEPTDA